MKAVLTVVYCLAGLCELENREFLQLPDLKSLCMALRKVSYLENLLDGLELSGVVS